jgi:hypothetical protein
MRSPRPLALLLVLALGGCGKDSGTTPDEAAGPVTGSYDLVIVPAAACGFPAGPYQTAVVAQQPGQTGSPPSANLRVTLPGGDSTLAMDMQFTSATVVRGAIATQPQAVAFGSAFLLFLRNVGMGTVSAAAGGRGEIRDGTMSGEVQVFQNEVDLGSCTSTGHRWSLRAR